MFCNNCGKEIANNIAFCNYCGAPVKPTVQKNTYQSTQANINYGSEAAEAEFLEAFDGIDPE